MHRQLTRRRYLAAAIGAVALAGLSARNASAAEGLTLDLRASGGGKTVTTSIGGTVTLDVFAQVQGLDGTGGNDGIQEVYASFLSNVAGGGTLNGTITAPQPTGFFGANGASAGASQDLSLPTDGNLDAGSNTPTDATGYWFARAGQPMFAPVANGGSASIPSNNQLTGSVIGNLYEVKLGSITFTANSGSGSTTVNAAQRGGGVAAGALWFEDSTTASNSNSATGSNTTGNITFTGQKDASSGTVALGSAVTISIGGGAAVGTWSGALGTAWDTTTTGNWTGGLPKAVGDTANFTATVSNQPSLNQSLTVSTMNFGGGSNYTVAAGGGTLTLDTSSAPAAVNVTAGTHVINAPVVLGKDLNANISGGSLTLANLTATGKTVNKSGAGQMTVNKIVGTGVNVTGGKLHIAQGGGTAGTSVVSNVAVSGAGSQLDLGDHKLIVTNGSANISTLNALVKSGAASPGAGQPPVWTGDGINTSAPLADGNGKVKAIGVAANSVNNAGTGLTSFAGQSVGPNDVLMGYTFSGDANMDGSVNFSDFLLLQNNYNGSTKLWQDGDFNYDGSVNFSDFLILQNNYNQSGATDVAGFTPAQQKQILSDFAVTAVPEPASLSVMALGAVGLLTRRRRKN